MENCQFNSFFTKERIRYFNALFVLFGVLLFLPIGSYAQVVFTQTTNADFNQGLQENVIVSGNNVYLTSKATSVNNWLSTTDLPQTLIGHQTTRWVNYIYLSGGYNGTDYSNSVYRATLSGTGNAGWTVYDTLPEPITNHAMVTGLNYIYILGGRTDGLPSDKIYYAEINSNGTLGPWTLSTVSLPQPLWGHTAHFQNGYLYIVGGTNSDLGTSAVNSVYYAKKMGLGGELTSFSTGNALPDDRNGHAMAFYNEQLIVTGGYDNGGTKQSTVYYSALNLDGTNAPWSSSTALTEAVSNHSSTCYNGLITIVGGETSGGLSDKIYYADIDMLPSLTWSLATDLLYEARKCGTAYTYNGVVVFAGGENISGLPIHNTRYASVTLGSEKVHSGTFLSYPFLQLGEERDIVSLSYNITYNATFNNYSLVYRTAGSDQIWGNWTEMNQDNPALVGEHKQYIQYLIQYDGTDDDNIVLHDMSVDISGYTQLYGNLNGMDTLKLVDSPFWVTGNISFTGGTHVIEAGVNILFSTNTGLEISQANMSFEGTAADPITLTSFTSEAGVWNGVYFNTNSDNGVSSQMDYVVIEKAGAGSWNANLYCVSTNEPQINNSTFQMAEGHGIRLNDADLSIESSETSNNTESGFYIQNSSPSLSNTDLVNNGYAGIYLVDLASSPNFFNCNITGNQFGIYYPSPNFSFPVISGITSYSNTISGIAMAGGTVSDDQVWPFNPLGYAVVGDVIIAKQNSHARLTIEPGNTIYFDSLVQLQVGNYIYYNQNYGGELFAIGKPDSVITFTSLNGQVGGWDGIYFHYNSDNFGSVSELTNCNILNGSSYNIRCEGTLQPRIDNCNITNSAEHDIYVQDPNSVPHITASTSTVYVDGGTQSIDKTWYNYGGGNYIILSDIIVAKQNDKATLTIQPGVTVKADTSALLQIANYIYYNKNYGGELFAEGKADSLITFTSRNGLTSGWDGIFFHYNSDAFGSSSSMKYCTVENGKDYNVKSSGSAEPRIDLCTINNSSGYDIYAVAPNDVQHITNTVSTVYVGAGTQSINKNWYNYGGDYVIVGDIIIAYEDSTARLTIAPGNTIKIDTTFNIQVGNYINAYHDYGGELFAEGKADSLITFTSRNGLTSGWDGIFFHYNSDAFGSSSSLKYCTVENGKDFNIKSDRSAEPRIDFCTINNSDGYDIYALAPNDVQHITNTVSTVYVGAGTQSINKNWYNYGGDYVIVGDIIIAYEDSTARLTIAPGNTIKIDTTFNIQVGNYINAYHDYGGELFAEGKADSLITFTSRNGLTSGWDGIFFHYNSDAFGSSSSLKYCTVENGDEFNIKSNGSSEPRIDFCTINNSSGYDIFAVAPNDVQHITNTNSTIYIGAGTQSINKTWYNYGGEYIVIGDVIIAKEDTYCTLTIEPGNTIEFDSAVILQIGNYINAYHDYGGEIIAEGTYDSLITFTSLNPVTDRWDGMYFHTNADNYGGNSSLMYCTIDGATTNNMYCDGTNILDLEHVTFINSGESGVQLNNSSPYLKLCQLINNDSIGVVLTGSSSPVIGDTLGLGCDIYGNGDFGIYNATANIIHAKNNFWNTTDSTTIAGMVYDFYDNASFGIVEFMPFATTSYFDNHPPDEFNLLSLVDNFVTTDQTPSFTWEIPIEPDGDPLTYHFYYTDDETWSTNIIVSESLTVPSYTIPETLIGGKYYWWKVKAKDGYLTKTSNQTWTFAVSIPPATPTPIIPSNGTLMRDNDYLVWLTTTDPDAGDFVSHYRLQLDDDPNFISPEVDTNGILVDGKTSSLSMQINDLPGYEGLENKNYYWRVSATDGFGIECDFSDGSNYFLYLLDHTIKVYLGGCFNGIEMETTLNDNDLLPMAQPYNIPPWNYMDYVGVTTMPADVVDWFLLEIRNGAGNPSTASNVLYRKAALLLKDGTITDANGSNIFEFPVSFDDNTFLTIYHRNHLAIISGTKLIPENGWYNNDFTTGSDKVWNGTAGYSEISPGIWGMSAGDANADKEIDMDDRNIDWSNEAGTPGYKATDFNMDGQVDNPDKNDRWLNNFGKSSQVPD